MWRQIFVTQWQICLNFAAIIKEIGWFKQGKDTCRLQKRQDRKPKLIWIKIVNLHQNEWMKTGVNGWFKWYLLPEILTGETLVEVT